MAGEHKKLRRDHKKQILFYMNTRAQTYSYLNQNNFRLYRKKEPCVCQNLFQKELL